MKYGILFSLLSLLLACSAFVSGGWFLLMLWPAVSFGVVGSGYLRLGHRVFGKRPDGSMSLPATVVLLPYLVFLWGVWHAIRVLSREPSYNTVMESVVIGRRLLSDELPAAIETVVDLTCEFPEPTAARSVPNYISIPMLDGSCLSADSLADVACRLAEIDSPMFIHCAQGHGRTGLVCALLLIARHQATDPEDALRLIQSSRPLVGLNRAQRSALDDAAAMLEATIDQRERPPKDDTTPPQGLR